MRFAVCLSPLSYVCCSVCGTLMLKLRVSRTERLDKALAERYNNK